MRTAIIGASGHYPYVTRGLEMRQDLTLCAIARGNAEENMTSLKNAMPETPYYEDWREMLDKEKPDICAVNPWYNRSYAIAAECLKRGIHVYCEKPVATTEADLEALYKAWQESPADLAGMFDGPHTTWLRTAKAEIDKGSIGNIRLLHGQKSYRMGVRNGVYLHKKDYGGMLQWIAIHPVSWFDYLIGQAPVSVSAQTDNHENGGFGELESTGCMLLRYPGGILATVNADFYRPVLSARHDDDRIRITGTKGMIEVRDGEVYMETEQTKMQKLALLQEENPFIAFVDSIGTEKAKAFAETAFNCTAACIQAALSAQKDTDGIQYRKMKGIE